MELYFRKTGFSSGKSPQWADKWGEKTAGEQQSAVFLDGEQCVGECEVHFVSGEADNLRARHFYKKNGFPGWEPPRAVTGNFQNEKTGERGEKKNWCLNVR